MTLELTRICGEGAPCEQACPIMKLQRGQACPTVETYFEESSSLAA